MAAFGARKRRDLPSHRSQMLFLALIISCLVERSQAHEHHTDEIPEGQAVSAEPLVSLSWIRSRITWLIVRKDTILWIHILIQILAFGIIFPSGMVLGIVRSRWHVPVQTAGAVIAILGYFLGHAHGGRQFAPNVHASFATSLMLMLFTQIVLGIYLRLHLTRGIHGRIRRYIVIGHGVVGKIMPIVSWIQMLFGGIAALGFCRDDHFGQCLAHFIMGSAFIGYGIVLMILLLVGQSWLKRTGRSQEFFDSSLITAWGIVNSFTEHRWGQAWEGNDIQHTSMGVVWWCAGLVGIWLSRKRHGGPKRNLIPGIVIFLTGWAMSGHAQALHLSTMVHGVFGYTLMAAGLTRIIEISFILRDRNTLSEDGTDPNSFQYLTPFLLCASGFLFMGATEEQMVLVAGAGVSHVSYILVLYSFAFLFFLFVNMLLHLYAVNAASPTQKPLPPVPLGNGHARGTRQADARRARDAEEFELEGLISEEEDSVDTPRKVERPSEVAT
ncbi:MAG: hypothetical protein M1833_000016 [Piccolia ochrophora]|nr:MAG: hypothetical protein M1833_000016 [Piccolia ochrophora]